jgi:hypothetical protein
MSNYTRNSVFKLIRNALSLFTDGRMFRDYRYLSTRLGMGAGGTAMLMVVLVLLGTPVILAALIAGFLGGMAMPYLFGDVKYQ